MHYVHLMLHIKSFIGNNHFPSIKIILTQIKHFKGLLNQNHLFAKINKHFLFSVVFQICNMLNFSCEYRHLNFTSTPLHWNARFRRECVENCRELWVIFLSDNVLQRWGQGVIALRHILFVKCFYTCYSYFYKFI